MTGNHEPTSASLGPLGADVIAVPAFFVTDDNAADLLHWKSEHPDWFVAGTWSGGSRQPGGEPAIEQRQRGRTPTPGLRGSEDYAEIAGPVTLPDRSMLSVRAFQAAAAAARSAAPPLAAPPLAAPVQFNPPPAPNTRMPGGGFRSRTTAEEFLEFRFNSALESIRRLEPHNRDLAYVRDPNRTPAEEQVRELEHEAEMARLRSQRVLPAEPAE
jgi:hypothetical protein